MKPHQRYLKKWLYIYFLTKSLLICDKSFYFKERFFCRTVFFTKGKCLIQNLKFLANILSVVQKSNLLAHKYFLRNTHLVEDWADVFALFI